MEALTKGLLPHYRRSQLFMQDNAGIHRSRAVAAFHIEHHINTIKWPAYSPDLNPIEHLWWALKRRMFKHYPQYNNYSKVAEEWEGFCEVLKKSGVAYLVSLSSDSSCQCLDASMLYKRRVDGKQNIESMRHFCFRNYASAIYIG